MRSSENKSVKTNNCDCIGIDTTQLSGNIQLIKCRNDSLMYFLAKTSDSCFVFWEEVYDDYRLKHRFCQEVYDYNQFIVIEVPCGNSYLTCFHVLSKYDFKQILYGELLYISKEKEVLLYSADDLNITAFFPNKNKYINYKIPNINDAYDYYEGIELIKIDEETLEIKSNKSNKIYILKS